MRKAFKYRLYPTKSQERALLATLETCRHTYNDALDARRDAYKGTGKGLSYTDQANGLVGHKNEYQQQVHSQVLQETLKRLDKSFQNFFRRVKLRKQGKKLKVGYPRRKSFNRYRSFCYPQSGFRLT
jgi:putative transposase